MSRISGPQQDDPDITRVVIIGNSNSVMRESYVRAFDKDSHFAITNRSIGSSPNVVLLDFIAMEQEWTYDFVIIETAVVDYLQSHGAYTAERSAETLELFIRLVRARSRAKIIILTIPTRLALLAPGFDWQESLYQDVAAKLCVPILDGFRLVRRLIGRERAASAGFFGSRASRLVNAFGLPANLGPSIAWRGMRDSHIKSNVLGTFAFVDHAHLSPAFHALIGNMLADYITLVGRRADKWSGSACQDLANVVIAATPDERREFQTSSLISREMVSLANDQSAQYSCPPGFLAYGILVNRATTCCFLKFQSPAGETTFDLRYLPSPIAWNAIVIAILDPVGDGDIVVSVQLRPEADRVRHVPDTTNEIGTPAAELGELILVRHDWRDLLPPHDAGSDRTFQIDLAPWADCLISDAAMPAAQVVVGIEAEHRLVETQCFDAATKIMAGRTAPLSSCDRARLMLLLGMNGGLADFVANALIQDPGNTELVCMQGLLAILSEEDEVKPQDLLNRANRFARTGAILEAEQVFVDAMARFPGEIASHIEYAWIAHRQKSWPEAKRRWRTVIDCFPNHHVGYLGMVNSLAESGDFSGAADCLATANSLFPTNTEVTNHHFWSQIEKQHR